MLHRMLAQLTDPLTAVVLGRLPTTGRTAPVVGFDLTFHPPKSVSVMWAMADRGTKAVIEDIMVEALAEMIGWAEDHVFRCRTGAQGARQEHVRGVVASAWMHYDSRDGDPQLHHHVVVLNRAQTASDGRWRTLDSRALHSWIVALSERHVGVVEDLMTARFGVAWREMATLAGRDLKREVEGVPPDLVAEFSRRTEAIEELIARKVRDFEAARGRPPTSGEMGAMHRSAWGETRRSKVHRSLADMTDEWTVRAKPWVGDHPTSWVSTLAGRSDLPALRSDDLSDEMLADVARSALQARSKTRSVFTLANVYADVERELHGVLFARGERATVAERAVGLALDMAVKITPTELVHVPERFRTPDRVSQFSPAASWQYTTRDLLDAEARLLDAGRDTAAPTVSYGAVAAVCDAPLPGRTYGMGSDQAVAVEQIATSGRIVDVLVGPAGTGKTTTLAGLLAAWGTEHGADSVVGLAPSASAAENLAEELGIACENTAKWLTEQDRQQERAVTIARMRSRLSGRLTPPVRQALTSQILDVERDLDRWRLRAGNLVIVDEAGMCGTFALDRLAAQARSAGAKILLVGDWAQLAAVDAGGAFGMLVDDRELAPELNEVHRFRAGWERRASIELRAGSRHGVDAYLAHARVADGNRVEMIETCYQAWRGDVAEGRTSLMIAQDMPTVVELNRRAHRDRVIAGEVAEGGLDLSDGLTGGVGDVVVTRRNDRRLRLANGDWVRNRDRWILTATHQDGSMTVRQTRGDQQVVLPASYVSEHVELGYASTAFSAQGQTTDTAHAVVGASMTREVLYVSATRGRDSNRLYVEVEPEPAGADMAHGPTERLDLREVLLTIAARRGADISAHQTVAAEWAKATSFEQLASEHQTLVAAATAERWERVMERVGIPDDVLARARDSFEWTGLLGALRDAENRGLNVEGVLPQLVGGRPIDEGKDAAAVLRARVHTWERATGGRWQPREDMVAGVVPRAGPVGDEDLGRAIREREGFIAQRARTLAEQAVGASAAWTAPFGGPPADASGGDTWWARIAIIAAYRERWGITSDRALGAKPDIRSAQQAAHRSRALRAGLEALELSRVARQGPASEPSATGPEVDRRTTI
jgi:conjugative relaxase-like TrwC/TraI family protein